MLQSLKEVLIVEGRNDSAAVKRAVNAQTIETHGFGIKKETWDLIEKAYHEKGIIIFTDPDFSGEQIRHKLRERFTKAKHAYLIAQDAEKCGDIGVENAAPEAIISAIQKSKATFEDRAANFTYKDIQKFELTGSPLASKRRARIGKFLGIGYGNASAFLNKLNQYGITTEEMNEAIFACGSRGIDEEI